MNLFDCNLRFGRSMVPSSVRCDTAQDLLRAMDRHGIGEALVYHVAMRDGSPLTGNPLLVSETRDLDRLHPTWSLLPSQTGESGTVEGLLDAMRANGIRALRAFPSQHRYRLDSVTFGPLFEAMTERRIPLFAPPEWETLARLLEDFPGLTLVATGHGCWGDDRLFRPLLERYPHFHVDTSRYEVSSGLPSLCREYGPDRLLFATDYPDHSMGGPVLTLSGAEIPESSRDAIAGDNLRRMLREAII